MFDVIKPGFLWFSNGWICLHGVLDYNSWKRFSLSDGHSAGGVELAPLNTLTYLLTYL